MKKMLERRKRHAIATCLNRIEQAKMRKLQSQKREIEKSLRIRRHRQMLIDCDCIVGGDLNRRPVILPANLSFWDNYDETLRCISEIRRFGMNERQPLQIRFDNVENLDLSAALVLASEIYRCRKLRIFRHGAFVTGNYPKNETIGMHMSEIGFFSLLDVRDFETPHSYEKKEDTMRAFFFPFITNNRVFAEKVDEFVALIEQRLFALNAAARGKLVGAIKEAMGNVFDHAYQSPTEVQSMSRRWFMSSRVDPEKAEVKIVLHDQGNGIPATLDADLLERIGAVLGGHADRYLHASDGYMIKLATEVWRTGTLQGGRGRGFRDMKRFVDISHDGELRVLSNRGHYTYMAGQESYGDHDVSTGGTTIEWRFRHSGPLEMIDD
jgi:hypothetical protein